MTPSEFSTKIKHVTIPLKGNIPTIKTYTLRVKKQYNGITILDFYTQVMPSISKQIWEQKIVSKNLTVKNKSVSINTIIHTGQITQHFTAPQTEPNISTNIELLEWNTDFIVINKPAPLPMHPSGRFSQNTLSEILKDAFPTENFKLVHRIDANTTGVVVIARNKMMASNLATQFKNQEIKKEYLTLVEGILTQKHFTLQQSISKKITASGSREISDIGKKATTDFTVLKKNTKKKTTLLSVIPHSGRTNQIRLHLANIGFPIVGDIGYKEEAYFKSNPLTYSSDCLFLHAHKLTFSYKNRLRTFEATIPEKFNI